MPWLRPPTSTYLNLKKVEIEGKLFVEEVHTGRNRTSGTNRILSLRDVLNEIIRDSE